MKAILKKTDLFDALPDDQKEICESLISNLSNINRSLELNQRPVVEKYGKRWYVQSDFYDRLLADPITACTSLSDYEGLILPSVTSIIDATLPKDYGYLSYITSFDSVQSYRNELYRLGQIGTLAHCLTSKILDGDVVEYNQIRSLFPDFNISIPLSDEDISKAYKATISFINFVVENVVYLGYTDTQLISESHGYMGTSDLICIVKKRTKGYHGEVYKTTTKNAQKGDPKISFKDIVNVCVVDFKTSKDFYSSHELQVSAYRSCLRSKILEFPVCTGLVRPDYDTLSYKLKFSDDENLVKDYSYFLSLFDVFEHKNRIHPTSLVSEYPDDILPKISFSILKDLHNGTD